jgi:hypothetical protein
MGVLEQLRIRPESDAESDTEFESEYPAESGSEFDYESNQNLDPAPGQAPPRSAPRAKARLTSVQEAGPRVTKKMRDDAQREVESIVQVIALAWGWQAPPCGDALESVAPEFAEKLTKILARNPRWLVRVRDGGLIADVITLFGTLAPVARAAYAHYGAPKENTDGPNVVFDPTAFPPYDGSGFSRAG